METQKKPHTHLFWFGFLWAAVIYIFLIFIQRNNVSPLNKDIFLQGNNADYSFYILLIVSFFLILFGLLLYKNILKKIDNAVSNNISPHRIEAHYAVYMIRLSSLEMIGILGLMFFYATGLMYQSLFLEALCIVSLLFLYPREKKSI